MSIFKVPDILNLKDNPFIKVLIVVVLILAIAWMFPRGESLEFEYRVGTIWVQKDLIAPFSFPIYKDERQYEGEREEAARGVFPVFYREEERFRDQIDNLRAVVSDLPSSWRSSL